MIQTLCENCVFATYNKSQQTGCLLGRVKKFQEKGYNVKFSNDSYIIGAPCVTKRPQEWVKLGDDIQEKIKKEIQLKFDVVVIGDDFDKISKTLDSITKSTIKPLCTRIILEETSLNDGLNFIRNHEFNQHYKWQVVNQERITESLNHAMRASKAAYCYLLDSGEILKSDIFEKINRLVNEELMQINVIYNEFSFNHMLIFNFLFNSIPGGFNNSYIEFSEKEFTKMNMMDKINYLRDKYGVTIYTWNTLKLQP